MRGEEYGVRHLNVEEPQSLLKFLSGLVSSERARLLCDLGSLYINDLRETDPHRELKAGDKVRVHLEPRRFPKGDELRSRITEETDDYIIVDKPPGLPVHALVDNVGENLISYLENELGYRLYVTHRLDVETSGLLVLAKNREAQARINSKFQKRLWKRTYVALTANPLPLGSHVHFMTKSPKAPKVVHPNETPESLRCELIVLKSDRSESLERWKIEAASTPALFRNEIQLLTGRTHQIRAQLAALGAPILGDQTYGSTFKILDSDTNAQAIALWAFQIQNLGE